MNSEKLYDILQETTEVYRKGDLITEKDTENFHVIEAFGYKNTNETSNNNLSEKVDMVFVDIVVNKEKAQYYKSDLQKIIDEYPEPGRLIKGPSYIELAPNLGLEQEETLRTMALGKVLGFWNIESGKSIGMNDNDARMLAEMGLLMITDYKSGVKK